MNNKRGSVGGKIALVLVLMIISAVGGGYGFSVLDGKMAVRDAQEIVKDVNVEDYDTEEAVAIQQYIDKANKDLETAKSRKEVHEITDEFIVNVSKVQTKTQKELEAARKEAEEARNANNNNNNNNNNYNNNNGYNSNDNNATDDGSYGTDNGNNSSGGYKDNSLNDAEDGTEDSGGLFNGFFNNGDQ